MLNKIKKMKLIDYWHLFLIIILYIPGIILKIFNKNIWIISENGNDAKDNGYAFFEYMMKQHKEIKCYYVIEKNSKVYNKVLKYRKNLLIHNSIKNVIYTIACKNYISSQLASSFPFSNIFFNMYMMHFFGFKYIFLQHGITQAKVDCFFKENSNISMFCCAANPEYDYVKSNFGYKDCEVIKTGFCRYDSIYSKRGNSNAILYMPTWRKFLEAPNGLISDSGEKKFLNSTYYKKISALVNNEKLLKELERSEINLYLCLHDNAICYKKYFKSKSKRVIIVDKDYSKSINDLIRECQYLITDISSVAFDFAYQNKSILYYQFDYDEILKSHWDKGYYNYEKDAFGKIVTEESDCVKEIIKAIKNNFSNSKKYIKKVKNFFCYNDNKNCERTYDEIIKYNENTKIMKRDLISNKMSVFSYIFALISIMLMTFGMINDNYLIMLFSNILVVFNNLFYGIFKLKKSIFFVIFNIAFFIFLISKPFIQTLNGTLWWNLHSYESIKLSFYTMFISSISLFMGLRISERININYKFKLKNIIVSLNSKNELFSIISSILFWVTILFKYVVEIEKLVFMTGKNYVEFYTSYQSSLPSFIHLIGGMAITFLCINLVLFPHKKSAIIKLIAYIFSAIPSLVIGQRNPIVLAILFSFSYCLLRDYYEKNDKWIGLKEKLIIIILIPIAIIGLNIHNYKRSNEAVNLNWFYNFSNFFYTQGVSFNVLNIGYENMDKIRSMNKNYVFGPVIDYFQDNTIAKKIFKFPGLGVGNNKTRAIKGNSFTHILAYLSRDDYLEGHGYGSSYILELYCNYGTLGIFIFSILLGYFLMLLPDLIKKKNLLSVICLQITMNIYFLPRSETLSSLMFIISPHFWCSIGLLFLVYFLIDKVRGSKYEN